MASPPFAFTVATAAEIVPDVATRTTAPPEPAPPMSFAAAADALSTQPVVSEIVDAVMFTTPPPTDWEVDESTVTAPPCEPFWLLKVSLTMVSTSP